MAVQADALIAQYEKEGISRVKLAFTDVDGVMRGKYISLDKFRSIAGGTSGFCDCVLGWDVADELYDNATFTGWHTAFPDAPYRLDLASERRLVDEGGIVHDHFAQHGALGLGEDGYGGHHLAVQRRGQRVDVVGSVEHRRRDS